jgi:hypothetical protein
MEAALDAVDRRQSNYPPSKKQAGTPRSDVPAVEV